MQETYHDDLRSRASYMARRLSEAGLTANVAGETLRDYSIKVRVGFDTQDFGSLVITTGRKGLKYHLAEMKGPDLGQVVKQCWYRGRMADAQNSLKTALATQKEIRSSRFQAYVDGSYEEGCGSYGAVILEGNEIIQELSGIVSKPESRNIDGEIEAALQVLGWCKERGVDQILIHHDYQGLSKWADGTWKTNKELTKSYARQVRQSGIKIFWEKVEAHSGDALNDRADALAKEALYRSMISPCMNAGVSASYRRAA